MALEYTTDSIGMLKDVYSGYAEQNIDADITLPDYCPDILRVLKCCVEPCVVSSKISGDRINTDGNARIRVLYADESGNICSYEQSSPFSKYVETGGDKTGALFFDAAVQYANCRAVNKRRLEVHAMLHISFKICEVAGMDIIDSIADSDVQTKVKEIDFSDITACECKQFPINETAQIPEDYLPVQRIVSAQAVPVISESKVIQGKCLVKGEIAVCIIYCTDNNFGECIKYGYSIPMNQVLEVAGLGEDSLCTAVPEIESCEFNVRNDAANQPRFIDISLVVSASVKAYKNKTSAVITDAYSISGALETDYENVSFFKKAESISDTFTFKNKLDFSALSPESISAVWLNKPKLNKKVTDGRIVFSGTACANIILIDSDKKPVFCERDFEFEYSRTTSAGDDALVSPSIAAVGCTYGNLNGGEAEIKAEFVISADVFTCEKSRALVSARQVTCSVPSGRCPSVVVYFSDCEETVWDVARKYSTTVQLIKDENNLTSDVLPCSTAVLIPVV